MGLGYVDSVIVYNRFESRADGELYFGTRFDNVRVEFTQEENQNKSGSENVSVCTLKISNNSTLPKPFLDPMEWKKLSKEEKLEHFTLSTDGDFFVVVKRNGLNLNVDAPVGIQSSNDPLYEDGFFEYIKRKYGYVYQMRTFAQFELIPYFQIGGQ